MTSERRQHQRIDVALAVELVTKDGASFAGTTRDVSIGGAFVTLAHTLPFGAEVKLRIRFPANKEPSEISTIVRWVLPEGVGVQFQALRAKDTWAVNQLLSKK